MHIGTVFVRLNTKVRRTGICLFSLFAMGIAASEAYGSYTAGEEIETSDTVFTNLPDIVITDKGKSPFMVNGGEMRIDMQEMGKYIRTLGIADPLNYIKQLPGVGQSDDYASGFSVEGSTYSQALVQVNGAPVFFPYHFGGIFTMINPEFCRNISFLHVPAENFSTSRIGPLVDARSRRGIPKKGTGNLSLGLVSCGAYVSVPFSRKVAIDLAARISCLNLFYGSLLRTSKAGYDYSFWDLNGCLTYMPDSCNLLSASYFHNDDVLRYTDRRHDNLTTLDWANDVASLAWSHDSQNMRLDADAWFSALGSAVGMNVVESMIRSSSRVTQYGIRGNLLPFALSAGAKGSLKFGITASYSTFCPQNVSGTGSLAVDTKSKESSQMEMSMSARSLLRCTPCFDLDVILAASFCSASGISRISPVPVVSGIFQAGNSDFKITAGCAVQYMHQVGISDIGLASNFWIGSSPVAPPERSYFFNVEWQYKIGGWSVSAVPYIKRILDESAYQGNLMNVTMRDYNPFDYMIKGCGWNAGADLSVTRIEGPVTGWVSYSLGIARRKYSDNPSVWVPSCNEQLHNMKIFIAWQIGDHWNLGANFRYSSGRPVTPISEVVVIAGNVIMSYGVRNSDRLPDYHRLDLSASYSFETGGRLPLRHSVNVSLLNVYGHANTDFMYYTYDSENKKFELRMNHSLFKFLPSLSYAIEF